ncbi:MAG: hypothetical protein AABY32_01500 [Nanoarchaeota archaeon]
MKVISVFTIGHCEGKPVIDNFYSFENDDIYDAERMFFDLLKKDNENIRHEDIAAHIRNGLYDCKNGDTIFINTSSIEK